MQTAIEEQQPTTAPQQCQTQNALETSDGDKPGLSDNGIFDFMTPDKAIELYNRIHSQGPPELEWKFYGRRKPGEQEKDTVQEQNSTRDEMPSGDQSGQNQTVNTEFDFDDDFSDFQNDTSIVNEGLGLNRRPEHGSEKKTNLSDIMSDIMKETS